MSGLVAADIEELVVLYLSQTFPNVGLDMPTTPPLPFYLVNLIPTGQNSWVTETNWVEVYAFSDTRTHAAEAARELALVMNPWAFTPKLSFTLSNGVTTGIDRFCILKKPAWHNYDDPNLQMYCGRYTIDLRVNQTS